MKRPHPDTFPPATNVYRVIVETHVEADSEAEAQELGLEDIFGHNMGVVTVEEV